MKLLKLRPQLYTEDLQKTIHFYTTYMDFTVVVLNKDWEWVSLKNGDVEWMFAAPNQHMPFGKCTLTGSLYLNVSDVDMWWKRLQDQVDIAYPLETFDYGMREFAFYDNNGYMIQMGAEVES